MPNVATRPPASEFRRRFLAGETLVGTFIKTPTGHATEILGGVGMDFVIVDQEHAPFDRAATDLALLAARASNVAAIVRVADAAPAKLLAALDDGALGVLVPHISSPQKARDMVAACRYRGGKRGFSNTNRGGDYGGTGIWEHVATQDQRITTIAMIEDPETLDVLDAILGTEGLDGVFIGRGDLTVALGADGLDSPRVMAAAEAIAAAARKSGKAVCMMAASATEAARFREMGASAFIISSDQGLMRQAASALVADFAAQNFSG
jgi:2-keto-3-deoxy-L-rhamnonate aldolase RhmA